MSEEQDQNLSENSKECDEKIQIYENDDAYLFGEDQSCNDSINNNESKENYELTNEEQLLDKTNKPAENYENTENKFQIKSINEIENNKEMNNNLNNNNIENDFPSNENFEINEINSETENQKLSKVEISDDENNNTEKSNSENNNIGYNNSENNYSENNNTENNSENNNIENNDTENNNSENNNIENNNIENNNIENINTENNIYTVKNNQILEQEYPENESTESGAVPLITLNFLSVCQCCKNHFNSGNNIPYLLKCGHFFCKNCIMKQFTDDEGIKCPSDGFVAKSLSELKILNNFINDKQILQKANENTNKKNICVIHKGQILTHYIEDTKELICIYCAFERFKKNPNVEIIEINEKCKKLENEFENIININKRNVSIIQSSIKEIKSNKENEEIKINDTFNRLIEMIKNKRDEYINIIEEIFNDNAKLLNKKLEILSINIEKCGKIKESIAKYKKNQEENFLQILNTSNKIITEFNKENNNIKIDLQKYNFKYMTENELSISNILSNFGEIEIQTKPCIFLNSISQNKTIEKNLTNQLNSLNQSNIKTNLISNNNNNCKDNFYNIINKDKNNSYSLSTCIHSQNTTPGINKNNNLGPSRVTPSNINLNNLNKSSFGYQNGLIKSHKNKLIPGNRNNNKILKMESLTSNKINNISKLPNNIVGVMRRNTPNILKKNYSYYYSSLGSNISINNMPSLNNNKKMVIKIGGDNSKKKGKSINKNGKPITAPSRIKYK